MITTHISSPKEDPPADALQLARDFIESLAQSAEENKQLILAVKAKKVLEALNQHLQASAKATPPSDWSIDPQHPFARLTTSKTQAIMAERGYRVTGYVLRSPDQQQVCISEYSAVRWMDHQKMYRVMHDDLAFHPDTPSEYASNLPLLIEESFCAGYAHAIGPKHDRKYAEAAGKKFARTACVVFNIPANIAPTNAAE